MDESAQALDLAQIERLAEKVKGLIDQLERTRSALAEASQENASLRREVDALRAQVEHAGAAQAAELQRLAEEREQIRERVQRMLLQIETIGASLEDQETLSEA
jgi:regulator of replication initiation timing